MIVIDTNSLLVLLLGLIEPTLINNHSRTSIYEEQDFHALMAKIDDLSNLIILPNVWTETDNLLKVTFNSTRKVRYIESIIKLVETTEEEYVEARSVVRQPHIYDLGITDCLLLRAAKDCQLLITSDSRLADYAVANGIKVYDMVKNRNQRLT